MAGKLTTSRATPGVGEAPGRQIELAWAPDSRVPRQVI